MLLQKNSTFISRSIFLLLILFSSLYSSYFPIYNQNSPDFKYSIENGNYVLTPKGQKTIEYKLYDGFKFYIPNFTREFSLQILRFNSVGYINGYLSKSTHLKYKNIISKNPNDLDYYFTDYKTDAKQLEYLLHNKILLYPKVTSIAIEAYNIPLKKELNRTFYFTVFKTNSEQNKLKYLVYSFKILLDKKSVDSFVKKYLKIKHHKNREFDYVYTYVNSLENNIKIVKQKKKIKKVKSKLKPKKKKKKYVAPYKLDLNRILHMKEFPFEQKESDESWFNISFIKGDISSLQSDIESLKSYLKTELDTSIILKPKYLIDEVDDSFYSINKSLNQILSQINASFNKKTSPCNRFVYSQVDKKCFVDTQYFNNYIYYAIKKDELPKEEMILGFGDYKTFNDVGKYYFEHGDYELAKRYLFKAYSLKEDSSIVNHNLGVLYSRFKDKENIKKSVNYLKKTDFKEDYFNLGVHYYIGLGVKEDNKQAYQYFLKSSKLNFEKAKNNEKIMKKYKIGI